MNSETLLALLCVVIMLLMLLCFMMRTFEIGKILRGKQKDNKD
jgi:hypothetical protein